MKRRVTVCAAGTATLAILTAAHAIAAPASRPASRVARYKATVDQTAGLNAQGVPSGLGQRGTVHAVLHAIGEPGGRAVGSIELELQVTSTRYPSTILETGTIELHRGTLAVTGVQNEGMPTEPLAITGATGHFPTRAGTVLIVDNGTVTIHLVKN